MKKYFVLLLLSFVLISCGKQENQPITITEVPKNMEQVVVENKEDKEDTIVENNEISNTWEIIENWSGENVKENNNFSDVNNSAKIYDAYISDDTEKVNSNFNDPLISDKTSLVKIIGTNYFKDKESVYFEWFGGLAKIEWINPNSVKWVIPYKSFTWSSLFLTDWKDLYYWVYNVNKVLKWDLSSLKFKIFWDNSLVATDKNNFYLSQTIFKFGINIENIKQSKLYNCLNDDINVYCIFGEFWWAPYDKLSWVDINSFEQVEWNIYKDINNTYNVLWLIENIDYKSNPEYIVGDNYVFKKSRNK